MIPSTSLDFLADARSDEPLRLGPEPLEETAPPPQVFVRTLSAPPAWPWEQRRNVELEARNGAPLPLSELLYRVRRLEAWRPGAPARFAAFYVLARHAGDELEAHAEVDGRQIAVSFGRKLRPTVQGGRLAGQAVLLAAGLLLIAGSVGSALAKRAQSEAALEMTEQKAAAKYRLLRVRERLHEEQLLLANQLDRGQPLRNVAADLAWASAAKSPDVRLEALHWQRGVMALEVRGDRSPLAPDSGRHVERSKRPVRTGVWLWGVGPAEAGSGVAPEAKSRHEEPQP